MSTLGTPRNCCSLPSVKRWGETETSYLTHLTKTIYRHKGETMGYGLKVWPEDFETVKSKAPEAANLGGL